MNQGMVTRAEKARDLANVTIFEGKVMASVSLANGLGKKHAFQRIVREFGETQTPFTQVLSPIWKYASEQAGTAAAPAADPAP
jgi:hypothetical protein